MCDSTEVKQTVFLVVQQGYGARYLLRTEILRTLKKHCKRVIVLTPNADEDYMRAEFDGDNVSVEPFRVDEYSKISKRPWHRFFRDVRWYAGNGKADLFTVDTRYGIHKKNRSNNNPLKVLYYIMQDIAVLLLRRSAFLRRFWIWTECAFLGPSISTDLFNKYKPDKIVVTSLGVLGYDHYVMREARRFGVEVISVILSWDNSSSKGMIGAFPDRVVTWTETMKKEVVEYSEIDPDRVYVGGIAHFDCHFNAQGRWSKAQTFERLGLDQDKKLIFYSLRSPNKYSWNPEIVEYLAKGLKASGLSDSCQLLIRLHPVNFKSRDGVYRFIDDTEAHMRLKEKYQDLLVYDMPEMLSEKLVIDMPQEEMIKISSLLCYSDVLLCFFSTMILEACIYDLPVVNVGLYTHNDLLDKSDNSAHKFPHLKRLLDSGGIRMASSKEDLLESIKSYLSDPGLDSAGRKRILDQECGPNRGCAGEAIANLIMNSGSSRN
ncbi:hypothetical protein BVX97_00920 [bacterium E08(2017)]|nr:hypothetical protein BVX97_00920 [bacterium E08(2017)]